VSILTTFELLARRLLTRTPSADVNNIGASGNGRDASWIRVHLLPIKGDAGTVDIEAGENLTNRPVKSKDDLSRVAALDENGPQLPGTDVWSHLDVSVWPPGRDEGDGVLCAQRHSSPRLESLTRSDHGLYLKYALHRLIL
jgi:hypothetical protein